MSADYTIVPARYAKGKMVLRSTKDGSGLKNRADRLAEALGGRYVGRSKGYVLSVVAAEKFELLYIAGFDAEIRMFFDDRRRAIFEHRDRHLDHLTSAQALACLSNGSVA